MFQNFLSLNRETFHAYKISTVRNHYKAPVLNKPLWRGAEWRGRASNADAVAFTRGKAVKHERESDCWLPDVRLTGLRIRLNERTSIEKHWTRLKEKLASHRRRRHRRRRRRRCCCQRRCTRPKTHSNTLLFPITLDFPWLSKDYRLGKGDQLRKMRTAAPRGGHAHYPRTRLSIVSIVLEGIESRGCGHGARRNTESKTRSIGRGHVEIRTRNVFFSLSLSLTEFFGHNRNENLVHQAISRLGPSSPLAHKVRVVHKASHKRFVPTSQRENSFSRTG